MTALIARRAFAQDCGPTSCLLCDFEMGMRTYETWPWNQNVNPASHTLIKSAVESAL